MKRLSFLQSAGISIDRAIVTISLQSRKNIQPIFEKISDSLRKGQSFSRSLELIPHSVPQFAFKIIKAGEESGQLNECLNYVSIEIEKRKNLKSKMISASIYPLLIGCGTIFLSLFLVFGIFPKVRSLFSSMHATLPFSTRFVMWISDILHQFGLQFLVALFLAIFGLRYYIRRSTRLVQAKDKALLSIPFIGRLISHYLLSSFFRTFGIMLKAHIPIHRALEYATDSIENTQYRQALHSVSDNVVSGNTLSQSLKQFPELFQDISIQLIEIGESTGNLANTFVYLSEMYDQEIEQTLKILVSVIEPVMMAIMGLMVGFISLSIITPIYAITQNLNH